MVTVPPYGAHKSCTRTAKTQESKRNNVPNNGSRTKLQISNRPNRSNWRERALYFARTSRIASPAAVPLLLLFWYLFSFRSPPFSDRNSMIFKNAHTNEMKCIFRVPPPRTIPHRWTLLCACDGTWAKQHTKQSIYAKWDFSVDFVCCWRMVI